MGRPCRAGEHLHGRGAGAVGVEEVAALDHKGFDDAVEFGELVALQRAGGGGPVADAVLAEVLGRERDGGGVEEHFYATEGFAWMGLVGWLVEFCSCLDWGYGDGG